MRMTAKAARQIFGSRIQGALGSAGSKYRNEKCTFGGMSFDSRFERDYWLYLEGEQKAGRIRQLQRQVKFLLIPPQYVDGKLAERACHYIADFTWRDLEGNMVVADTKGYETPEFIIKRKLMLERFGIRVTIVKRKGRA